MKTAFLILGAQRSGTSVTSHLLCQLGVNFGRSSQFIQDHHNPIFFELNWVNQYNNCLINCLGHKYTEFFLPVEADFAEVRIATLRQKLSELMSREWQGQDLIGLKDPRFSLTFPVWHQVLLGHQFRLKVVLVFRSPQGFLASNKQLLQNWGWSETRHLHFWLQLNLAAVYFTRSCSVYFLDYDCLMKNPLAETTKLAEEFQLNVDRVEAASKVIQNSHYHHPPGGQTGEPLVDWCYAQLCHRTLNPAAYLAYQQLIKWSD